MTAPFRVAVVGGGIAGLAAALELTERAPAGSAVTLYERSAMLGGKISTGTLAGGPVEFGAEAFLTRDPDGGESAALSLTRALGLSGALTHPAVGRAAVAVDGELRPLPEGTLVGVPGDPAKVTALAQPVLARDPDEGRPLLRPDEDPTVGELVRRRLGDEVVDRLVDPMLGGVYAGRADSLSLAATMPALARAARVEHTLTAAVRAARAASPRMPGEPVFATLLGGLGQLVTAAADALVAAGGRIRLDATVRELVPTATGWRLTIGPGPDAERVSVDAVVLAVPARPAARLLEGVDSAAARLIGELDYASVALVTLALPAVSLPEISGFLVPAGEGTLIKAATFFGTKWAHQRRRGGIVLLRASIGRYGEEHLLRRPDGQLIDIVRSELSTLTGVELPQPVEALVRRWGGALPQYAPGHLDRVAAVRTALRAGHPNLALVGAGYDGVGIPACVRSGKTGAEEILEALGGLQ